MQSSSSIIEDEENEEYRKDSVRTSGLALFYIDFLSFQFMFDIYYSIGTGGWSELFI